MTADAWQALHSRYQDQDWIAKPSIFAETAITYFPPTSKMLDLGAGLGQDSLFFLQQGYDVTTTDLNDEKLKSNEKLNQQLGDVIIQQVDLRQPLPFEAETFNIVYAHLSLHYFDKATTERIFEDIKRVLEPGGVLAFFVNSTSDPEYGTGKELEPDFFQIDKVTKRYFSLKTTQDFTHRFQTKLLDDKGETYKDSAIGVHNLIRYIGVKRA